LLALGGAKLHLPVDLVVASELAEQAEHRVTPADRVPAGWRAVDIGPETVTAFGELVRTARTLLWNGPVGVFEIEPFSAGTRALARAIAGSEAVSIVGGGDSVAAIQQMGLADQFTHLSTGGGAALALLEGKPLPGLAVLQD
jgi:phosphoglycerate kinase